MKNKYFKIFLLCGLLLAFGTMSFAQKKKRPPVKRAYRIVSKDFEKPASNSGVRSNRPKNIKKWRKRCRYESFRRKGRITKVYRCRSVRY